MKPFRIVKGIAALLDLPNVDTDQIIPKQFLKRIERSGFGQFLFYDWRFTKDGKDDPSFGMNAKRYQGAKVLVTRTNFGCGSSREHAPWALLDYGFRCLIAPSFADIFYNNCFKNGILPVRLHEAEVETLFQHIQATPGYVLCVDLEREEIRTDDGLVFKIKITPFQRISLLDGLDDICMTLEKEAQIQAYESKQLKVPLPLL